MRAWGGRGRRRGDCDGEVDDDDPDHDVSM